MTRVRVNCGQFPGSRMLDCIIYKTLMDIHWGVGPSNFTYEHQAVLSFPRQLYPPCARAIIPELSPNVVVARALRP